MSRTLATLDTSTAPHDLWRATRRVRTAMWRKDRATRYSAREWANLTSREQDVVKYMARQLRVTVIVTGVGTL